MAKGWVDVSGLLIKDMLCMPDGMEIISSVVRLIGDSEVVLRLEIEHPDIEPGQQLKPKFQLDLKADDPRDRWTAKWLKLL